MSKKKRRRQAGSGCSGTGAKKDGSKDDTGSSEKGPEENPLSCPFSGHSGYRGDLVSCLQAQVPRQEKQRTQYPPDYTGYNPGGPDWLLRIHEGKNSQPGCARRQRRTVCQHILPGSPDIPLSLLAVYVHLSYYSPSS